MRKWIQFWTKGGWAIRKTKYEQVFKIEKQFVQGQSAKKSLCKGEKSSYATMGGKNKFRARLELPNPSQISNDQSQKTTTALYTYLVCSVFIWLMAYVLCGFVVWFIASKTD